MSVLIKGMDMPERCWDCDLCYDCFYCRLLEVRFIDREDFEPGERRLSDCPLVPVPPHGKLIEKRDVFKLIWAFPNVDRQLPVEFMDALYELPTIIPAEEEDHNEN